MRIKKDVVIDGKDKKTIWACITSETTSNFDKSDKISKSRPPKFFSFLLLIDQDVLSELQLQFW